MNGADVHFGHADKIRVPLATAIGHALLELAAAFSVKVNAAIFRGWSPAPPASAGEKRFVMCWATTLVFPEPARAISWRLPLT
jgi:hypothetical protein